MPLKTIIYILFACFSLHQSFGQKLWHINDDRVNTWNYAWGDEFSANEIDTSKWLDSYPWGRTLYCSRDNHYYTEFKNCELRNGILSCIAKPEKIHARAVPYEPDTFRLICNGKDHGQNLQTFDYTCGMIFSKNKYHYGYYEIRFRSEDKRGLWNAFWLYAGHENEEIDIFELNGSRNQDMHVDVHCPKGCKNYKTTLGLLRKNWGDYLSTSSNWNSGFNVVSIEWQREFVKWYLNGQPVAYWKGNFEHPMWIITGIGLARDGGAFGPGPDATTVFPAFFEIDYIRVWYASQQGQKNSKWQTLESSAPVNKDKIAVLKRGSKPESKRKIIKENSTFVLFTPTGKNSYFIEVTGSIPKNLTVQVENSSGKMIYTSTDIHLKRHEFSSEGTGLVKININGKKIEQPF